MKGLMTLALVVAFVAFVIAIQAYDTAQKISVALTERRVADDLHVIASTMTRPRTRPYWLYVSSDWCGLYDYSGLYVARIQCHAEAGNAVITQIFLPDGFDLKTLEVK